jgi:hypothetical protein
MDLTSSGQYWYHLYVLDLLSVAPTSVTGALMCDTNIVFRHPRPPSPLPTYHSAKAPGGTPKDRPYLYSSSFLSLVRLGLPV